MAWHGICIIDFMGTALLGYDTALLAPFYRAH